VGGVASVASVVVVTMGENVTPEHDSFFIENAIHL
jgi:hypothetical protein